jgi:hypothetical protein
MGEYLLADRLLKLLILSFEASQLLESGEKKEAS